MQSTLSIFERITPTLPVKAVVNSKLDETNVTAHVTDEITLDLIDEDHEAPILRDATRVKPDLELEEQKDREDTDEDPRGLYQKIVTTVARRFWKEVNEILYLTVDEMEHVISAALRGPSPQEYQHIVPPDFSCFEVLNALNINDVLAPDTILELFPHLSLSAVEDIARFYHVQPSQCTVLMIMEFFAHMLSVHPLGEGRRVLVEKTNSVIDASLGDDVPDETLVDEFQADIEHEFDLLSDGNEQTSLEVTDFFLVFRVIARLCAIHRLDLTSFVDYAFRLENQADDTVRIESDDCAEDDCQLVDEERLVKYRRYVNVALSAQLHQRSPLLVTGFPTYIAQWLTVSDWFALRGTANFLRSRLTIEFFDRVMSQRGNFNLQNAPDIISHCLEVETGDAQHPVEFRRWCKEISVGHRTGWSDAECLRFLAWLVKYQRKGACWPKLSLHDIFWLQFFGLFGIARDYVRHLIDECEVEGKIDCSMVFEKFSLCSQFFPHRVHYIQSGRSRASASFRLPREVLPEISLYRLIGVTGHDVVVAEILKVVESKMASFVGAIKEDMDEAATWVCDEGHDFALMCKDIRSWTREHAVVIGTDPEFMRVVRHRPLEF